MLCFLIFLALGARLVQFIDASPLLPRQQNLVTKQLCYTLYTSKPTKITTITVKNKATATSRSLLAITTTPIVTRTLPTSTTTVTRTVIATSTAAAADAAIKRTTVTTSLTGTVTNWQTIVLTTSSGSSTTTIAAPESFRYPSAVAMKRSVYVLSGKLPRRQAAKYPYKVYCTSTIVNVLVTTVTRTAGTRTTTINPNPVTSTVTFQNVVYFTPQAATITQTITQTFSATATVQYTTTSTKITGVIPTTTYYAVCGAQNQLSSDSSGNNLAIESNNSPNSVTLNVNSAYDCCVACVTTPNCAGSNFIGGLTGSSVNCQLAVYSSCPSNQGQVADTFSSSQSFISTTFSNGLCGAYQFQQQ